MTKINSFNRSITGFSNTTNYNTKIDYGVDALTSDGWNNFKQQASNTTAFQIWAATAPPIWKDLTTKTANQLYIYPYKFDNENQKITVMIMRIKSDFKTTRGIFEIDYNDKIYNLSNWKCTQQPVEIPSVNMNQWINFKKQAAEVSPYSLIYNTHWWNNKNIKVNTETKVVKTNYDDVDFSVTATLIIYRGIESEKITFKNNYWDDPTYSGAMWTVISSSEKTGSWNDFKKAALSVTPVQLIDEYRQDPHNKFIWDSGDVNQIVWNAKDSAEFDIYGSLNDNDIYKGMQGKPTIDEKNKTVTAIISKVGRAGLYDSDPIKATIRYTKDNGNYDVWKWTFSKLNQVQSYEKAMSVYNIQLAIAREYWHNPHVPFYGDIKYFSQNNWVNFENFQSANKHQAINTYYSQMIQNKHYFLAWKWKLDDYAVKKAKSLELYISFKYTSKFQPPDHPYDIFNIVSNCWYINGLNINDGVSAFNYIWSGYLSW